MTKPRTTLETLMDNIARAIVLEPMQEATKGTRRIVGPIHDDLRREMAADLYGAPERTESHFGIDFDIYLTEEGLTMIHSFFETHSLGWIIMKEVPG